MYVCRVHLEAGQSVRSMKLSLAAYSAAVDALVLVEPNDAEQTGGRVGRGGDNSLS